MPRRTTVVPSAAAASAALAAFAAFAAFALALAAPAPLCAQEPFDLGAAFAAAQAPGAENRWTLVPWRHSLTDALAEAARDDKPVYLFVNDGDVESGRC